MPSLAAKQSNAAGVVEVPAHRLLHQDDGPRRDLSEHVKRVFRRDGDIEHRVRLGDRLFDRIVNASYVETRGGGLATRRIDIINTRHRQASVSISGQMRIVDDSARAEHHDRSRAGRQRPSVAQRANCRDGILV